MKALKIDLGDFVRSGEGANGSSYDSISDPSVMIKLYNVDYPLQPIIDELEVARKVYDLGVKSPEPGELVTDGERTGIRFRRIIGKKSFSRMIADNPERTEEYARDFAFLCRELHAIECPEGMFPSAKEQYSSLADKVNGLDEGQRNFLKEMLAGLPDSTTALHGDMHMGNVIRTGNEDYFIDLGYFAQGYPLIDLGMTYSICNASSKDFVEHDFHVSQDLLRERFWPVFVENYFHNPVLGDSPCLKDIDENDIDGSLLKFYCIKSLLVGYNVGTMLPEALEAIEKVRRNA